MAFSRSDYVSAFQRQHPDSGWSEDEILGFYRDKFTQDGTIDQHPDLVAPAAAPAEDDLQSLINYGTNFAESAPEAAPAGDGGYLDTARRGFGRGIDNMQAALYDTARWAGDVSGLDSVAEWGKEGVVRNNKEAAEYGAAPVANFSDIGKSGSYLRDFSMYLTNLVAEQAPQILGTIAAGAAIAAGSEVIAGGAAVGAGTAAALRAVPLLSRVLGLGEAGTQLLVSRVASSLGSAAFGASQMNNYSDLKDEGGTNAAGWAAFNMALGGLLEGALPSKLLSKMGNPSAKEATGLIADFARKVVPDRMAFAAAEAAESGSTEFLTEMSQELIAAYSEYRSLPEDKKPTMEQVSNRVINAGVAGFLVGGLAGGVEAGLSGRDEGQTSAAQPVQKPAEVVRDQSVGLATPTVPAEYEGTSVSAQAQSLYESASKELGEVAEEENVAAKAAEDSYAALWGQAAAAPTSAPSAPAAVAPVSPARSAAYAARAAETEAQSEIAQADATQPTYQVGQKFESVVSADGQPVGTEVTVTQDFGDGTYGVQFQQEGKPVEARVPASQLEGPVAAAAPAPAPTQGTLTPSEATAIGKQEVKAEAAADVVKTPTEIREAAAPEGPTTLNIPPIAPPPALQPGYKLEPAPVATPAQTAAPAPATVTPAPAPVTKAPSAPVAPTAAELGITKGTEYFAPTTELLQPGRFANPAQLVVEKSTGKYFLLPLKLLKTKGKETIAVPGETPKAKAGAGRKATNAYYADVMERFEPLNLVDLGSPLAAPQELPGKPDLTPVTDLSGTTGIVKAAQEAGVVSPRQFATFVKRLPGPLQAIVTASQNVAKDPETFFKLLSPFGVTEDSLRGITENRRQAIINALLAKTLPAETPAKSRGVSLETLGSLEEAPNVGALTKALETALTPEAVVPEAKPADGTSQAGAVQDDLTQHGVSEEAAKVAKEKENLQFKILGTQLAAVMKLPLPVITEGYRKAVTKLGAANMPEKEVALAQKFHTTLLRAIDSLKAKIPEGYAVDPTTGAGAKVLFDRIASANGIKSETKNRLEAANTKLAPNPVTEGEASAARTFSPSDVRLDKPASMRVWNSVLATAKAFNVKVTIAEVKAGVGGGAVDLSKNAILLAIKNVGEPTRNDLRMLMHEVAHVLIEKAPVSVQNAFAAWIEAHFDETTLDEATSDPRIRQGVGLEPGRGRGQLSNEESVEFIAQAGIASEEAAGLIESFWRLLKDVLLQAALKFQEKFFGPEFTGTDLAKSWAENLAERIANGDFETLAAFTEKFTKPVTFAVHALNLGGTVTTPSTGEIRYFVPRDLSPESMTARILAPLQGMIDTINAERLADYSAAEKLWQEAGGNIDANTYAHSPSSDLMSLGNQDVRATVMNLVLERAWVGSMVDSLKQLHKSAIAAWPDTLKALKPELRAKGQGIAEDMNDFSAFLKLMKLPDLEKHFKDSFATAAGNLSLVTGDTVDATTKMLEGALAPVTSIDSLEKLPDILGVKLSDENLQRRILEAKKDFIVNARRIRGKQANLLSDLQTTIVELSSTRAKNEQLQLDLLSRLGDAKFTHAYVLSRLRDYIETDVSKIKDALHLGEAIGENLFAPDELDAKARKFLENRSALVAALESIDLGGLTVAELVKDLDFVITQADAKSSDVGLTSLSPADFILELRALAQVPGNERIAETGLYKLLVSSPATTEEKVAARLLTRQLLKFMEGESHVADLVLTQTSAREDRFKDLLRIREAILDRSKSERAALMKDIATDARLAKRWAKWSTKLASLQAAQDNLATAERIEPLSRALLKEIDASILRAEAVLQMSTEFELTEGGQIPDLSNPNISLTEIHRQAEPLTVTLDRKAPGFWSNKRVDEIQRQYEAWLSANEGKPGIEGAVFNQIVEINRQLKSYMLNLDEKLRPSGGLFSSKYTNWLNWLLSTGTLDAQVASRRYTDYEAKHRRLRNSAIENGARFDSALHKFKDAIGYGGPDIVDCIDEIARYAENELLLDVGAVLSHFRNQYRASGDKLREAIASDQHWAKFIELYRLNEAGLKNISAIGKSLGVRVADSSLVTSRVWGEARQGGGDRMAPAVRSTMEKGTGITTAPAVYGDPVTQAFLGLQAILEGGGSASFDKDVKLLGDPAFDPNVMPKVQSVFAALEKNASAMTHIINPIFTAWRDLSLRLPKLEALHKGDVPSMVSQIAWAKANGSIEGYLREVYRSTTAGVTPEAGDMTEDQYVVSGYKWLAGVLRGYRGQMITTDDNFNMVFLGSASIMIDARRVDSHPGGFVRRMNSTTEDLSRFAQALAIKTSFGRNFNGVFANMGSAAQKVKDLSAEWTNPADYPGNNVRERQAAFMKADPERAEDAKQASQVWAGIQRKDFQLSLKDSINPVDSGLESMDFLSRAFGLSVSMMLTGGRSGLKDLINPVTSRATFLKSGGPAYWAAVMGDYATALKYLAAGAINVPLGLISFNHLLVSPDAAAIKFFYDETGPLPNQSAKLSDLLRGSHGYKLEKSESQVWRKLEVVANLVNRATLGSHDPRQAPKLNINPKATAQNAANVGQMVQDLYRTEGIIRKIAAFYRDNPSRMGEVITASDAHSSEASFNAYTEGLNRFGISLFRIAEDLAKGKIAQPRDGISPSALQAFTISQITGEGTLLNRPVVTQTTKSGRLLTTLLGFQFDATSKIAGMMKSPEGRIEMGRIAASIPVLCAGMVPAALLYSLLIDAYDDNLLKKRAALRRIKGKDLAKDVAAGFERLQYLGVGGIFADIPGSFMTQNDNAVGANMFSIDNRVLIVKELINIQQALSAAIATGPSNWNYANVGRPALMSIGAGGMLQNLAVLRNITGGAFDSVPLAGDLAKAETTVNERQNAGNWMRIAMKEQGIELRRAMGSSTLTEASPWVTDMVLAAYSNDVAAFKKAYNGAINAYIRMDNADPEGAVKGAFSSRHILRSFARNNLSEAEVFRLLKTLPPEGQAAVKEAITQLNAYGSALGIPEYWGSKNTTSKTELLHVSREMGFGDNVGAMRAALAARRNAD